MALDLDTRTRMHALRDNFEPVILQIRCDQHHFASKIEKIFFWPVAVLRKYLITCILTGRSIGYA